MEIPFGHENICAFFEQALANDHLFHAYGFVGPDGVGKRTTARWLGAKFLGVEEQRLDQHPDFLFLRRGQKKDGSPEHALSVTGVRSVTSFLSQTPFCGSRKIAILDEFETVELAGANALLKTLEEPSRGSLILLLLKSERELPETIGSRCHFIQFQPVSTVSLAAWLSGKGVSHADEIAEISQGLPGRAFDALKDEASLVWRKTEYFRLDELVGLPLFEKAAHIAPLLKEAEDRHSRARDRMIEALSLWRLRLHTWLFREDIRPFRSRADLPRMDRAFLKAMEDIESYANPRLVFHHVLSLFP